MSWSVSRADFDGLVFSDIQFFIAVKLTSI